MAGNSWQSPVSGEPSLGTPHPHKQVILNGADPADTNVHSIDVSIYVPIGTTWMEGEIRATSTSVGDIFMVCESGGDDYDYVRTQVANTEIMGHFSCPVTSGRLIYWKATSANITSATLKMTRYWT